MHPHRRIVVQTIETLHEDAHCFILPSPHDLDIETTLRRLAAINPCTAHHLAYALHDNAPIGAHDA
jgi:hypothetical protein